MRTEGTASAANQQSRDMIMGGALNSLTTSEGAQEMPTSQGNMVGKKMLQTVAGALEMTASAVPASGIEEAAVHFAEQKLRELSDIIQSDFTVGTQTRAASTSDKAALTSTQTDANGNTVTNTPGSTVAQTLFTDSTGNLVTLDIEHTIRMANNPPAAGVLLSTTTTTTTAPVCYRYDAATSAWTTTGVTTSEASGQVSCVTTLSGAIMVVY